MAEVGSIVNVSGSRIATPFGPPSPGSTPTKMPRDRKSVVIGIVVSASIFAMFEIWFKVPLYKGAWDPLSFLGY